MRIRASSVFLISAALLSFEVLWLRLFAITEYYHFAYMAVGVALLGIGASGTALALLRDRVRGQEVGAYVGCAGSLSLCLLAAPVVVGLLPFEPTQIVWDRSQWVVIGGAYFALAVPFFLGGACLVLALQHDPARSAALYGANLLGAGAGAGGTLLVLYLLPPQATPAVAAIGAVAGAALALDRGAGRRIGVPIGLLGLVALIAVARPPWALEITPFKALPQARAYPDASERGSAWDPTGWVVALEAPALRDAPGLSLAYRGSLPPQVGLFLDGESVGGVTRWEGDTAKLGFARWLPSAAPYALGRRERVLVVGAGGGLEVLSARAHGVRQVTAVELSSSVVSLADRVAGPASASYRRPGVTAVVGDGRLFLRRSGERFDLIQFGPTGSLAAAAGGVHALDVDYLNTVDAYADALGRLTPGGVLAVTRWVRLPPRDNVKVIATATAALRKMGHDEVGPRFVVLRSWANVVVLVKPGGFTPEETAGLRAFAESRFFDLDWLAGEPPADAPIFNVLEPPAYAEAARAASAGPDSADAFFRAYPFAVRPATDARPFFSRFLSVRQAVGLLRRPVPEWAPYAEWGTLALLATLAQGAVLAAAFLVWPAWWSRRRRTRHGAAARGLGPGLAAVYFGALGLGYLLVEMAFIQRLQLWLGHPVYAVAATIAGFLVLSGAGSLWYQGRSLPRGWWAAAVVAAMIPLYVWVLAGAGDLPSRWPVLTRAGAVALLLVPLASVMGVPFPAGLRRLGEAGDIAWAWAVNGFASVIAAPLAVLISMEASFLAVLLGGALCYAVAAAALARDARPL